MQDLINSLSNTPGLTIVAAFLAGIFVAINPCQIAICVSSLLFFVDKEDGKPQFAKKTLLFALGRGLLYFFLALSIILSVKMLGFKIENIYSYELTEAVEKYLPYIILLIATLFLYRAIANHHHSESCHSSVGIIKKQKNISIFVVGVLLALVFCPESAILYFGVMMPIALMSNIRIILLAIFAIAAVLPLLFIALVSNKSIEKSFIIQGKLEKLQVYINYISATILLMIAIMLLISN